jgi:hypothetical protein
MARRTKAAPVSVPSHSPKVRAFEEGVSVIFFLTQTLLSQGGGISTGTGEKGIFFFLLIGGK